MAEQLFRSSGAAAPLSLRRVLRVEQHLLSPRQIDKKGCLGLRWIFFLTARLASDLNIKIHFMHK